MILLESLGILDTISVRLSLSGRDYHPTLGYLIMGSKLFITITTANHRAIAVGVLTNLMGSITDSFARTSFSLASS